MRRDLLALAWALIGATWATNTAVPKFIPLEPALELPSPTTKITGDSQISLSPLEIRIGSCTKPHGCGGSIHWRLPDDLRRVWVTATLEADHLPADASERYARVHLMQSDENGALLWDLPHQVSGLLDRGVAQNEQPFILEHPESAQLIAEFHATSGEFFVHELRVHRARWSSAYLIAAAALGFGWLSLAYLLWRSAKDRRRNWIPASIAIAGMLLPSTLERLILPISNSTAHLIGFSILAALSRGNAWLALCTLAVAAEVLQTFTFDRYASWEDLAWDALGLTVGDLIRRAIEWKDASSSAGTGSPSDR